jgi:peptide alpha-N-acetyltransferase
LSLFSDNGEYSDDGTKNDPEKTEVHGHVNSISVLRSYRRLGLARKLMVLSRASLIPHCYLTPLFFVYVVAVANAGSMYSNLEEAMSTIYNASFVSLHVRKSNKAAIALYRDSLGFQVAKVEAKYCVYSFPSLLHPHDF